ncbi:MAG: hypothetical protein N3G21_12650 [Candidatus Hydrogenedentes bacterium]|nr:hypothetical protein [Candidatus Hydrogenedentota bacterium]
MIYKFQRVYIQDGLELGEVAMGRFIIHRHSDIAGEHIDIRLEEDFSLVGWRVDGTSELGDEMWGVAKLPHHPGLLDDGTIPVVAKGKFRWLLDNKDDTFLELEFDDGEIRVYKVEKHGGLPASIQNRLNKIISDNGLSWDEALSLIGDGIKAREWLITKICGMVEYSGNYILPQAEYAEYLKGKSLDELKRNLTYWEKKVSSNQSVGRLTRPGDIGQEGESEKWKLSKVLELIVGRD